MKFIRERGGQMFSPKPSSTHSGHFRTYLEMADLPVESLPTPDQHQPSFLAKQKDGSKPLGRCPKCPSYSFSSTAEKLRHCRIMHNITSSDMRTLDCTDSGRKNRWICSFETGVNKTCGVSFKYERELRLHKKATGHALNVPLDEWWRRVDT